MDPAGCLSLSGNSNVLVAWWVEIRRTLWYIVYRISRKEGHIG